jgi:hypothetical protein
MDNIAKCGTDPFYEVAILGPPAIVLPIIAPEAVPILIPVYKRVLVP